MPTHPKGGLHGSISNPWQLANLSKQKIPARGPAAASTTIVFITFI
jgi:hypothetical protein